MLANNSSCWIAYHRLLPVLSCLQYLNSEIQLRNGMESKQFGLSLEETRAFGSNELINQPNIVSAKIPNRILFRLDFTPVDVGIFKSGGVTVQSSMLDAFNSSIISLMFL